MNHLKELYKILLVDTLIEKCNCREVEGGFNLGNEVGVQPKLTDEALLGAPVQTLDGITVAELPHNQAAEPKLYVQLHASGKVERATRDEVEKLCPVLGKLALEAPEEVELLLTLAALGHAEMAADNNSDPHTIQHAKREDKVPDNKKPIVGIKKAIQESTEQLLETIPQQQMNNTIAEKLDKNRHDLLRAQAVNINMIVHQEEKKFTQDVVGVLVPKHKITTVKPQKFESLLNSLQIIIPRTAIDVTVIKIYPDASQFETKVQVNEPESVETEVVNAITSDTLPVRPSNEVKLESDYTIVSITEPYNTLNQAEFVTPVEADNTSALYNQEDIGNNDEQDSLIVESDCTVIRERSPDEVSEDESTVVGMVDTVSNDIFAYEQIESIDEVTIDSMVNKKDDTNEFEIPITMQEIIIEADTHSLEQTLDQIEQCIIEPREDSIDTKYVDCMKSIREVLIAAVNGGADTASKVSLELNEEITDLIINLLQQIGCTKPHKVLQEYTNLLGSENLLQRLEYIYQRYAGDAKIEDISLSVYNPQTTNTFIPVRFGKSLIKFLASVRFEPYNKLAGTAA